MISYNLEDICRIVKGKWLLNPVNSTIEHLATDTRKVALRDTALFFALKSKTGDGHNYVHSGYTSGLRHFIVSQELDVTSIPDAHIILVKDTLKALQLLVAHHRKQFNIPVIGITGSNGKTVVKEWINQLLQDDYTIVRSPRSYNSQIGVPLSVWQMQPYHTLGIFEAGISQSDEMNNLADIIKPTIGVFTNIGNAHDDGFLNRRHKINEKLGLFINADVLIYCRDYDDIHENVVSHLGRNKKEKGEVLKTFTWSKLQRNADAPVVIDKGEESSSSTHIHIVYNNKIVELTLPFIDDASIENAINALMVMLYLQYPAHVMAERVSRLSALEMRLETVDAINESILINDSYSNDYSSFNIALEYMNRQALQKKRTVILSDMLHSGEPDVDLYTRINTLLIESHVSRLIGIGPGISNNKGLFSSISNTLFFPDTKSFINAFGAIVFEDETILLKGARAFAFERIARMLQKKTHGTILEINLQHLVYNLKVFQSFLNPSVKTMVMVKAFSYGSGSEEVARTLQYHNIDYLGVAYADEGVALRMAGIRLPIMVMNADDKSFLPNVQYNLETSVYSVAQLIRLINALNAHYNEIPSHKIHIELETGMNRLGFSADDLPYVVELLGNQPHLSVASIYTHLAGSEEAGLEDFTHQQISTFEQMSMGLQEAIGYKTLRHVLNTGGITRFKKAQYDMVRLGIGLYGYDSAQNIQDQLENISSLKSVVSQIKQVKAGDTIGYNRKGLIHRDTTVATVAIGYADGYSRRFSNGKGNMYVKGIQVPVIGNVCMDMTMLDVTEVDGIKEGDEVLVFGDKLPVSTLAQWADTIPYEVLAGISARVKRVYYEE